MRVHDDGSIAGACVGSKGTERYDVRVRVSVAHADAAHPPPQGASTFEGAWIEATCTCPAATKPPFVQHGAAAPKIQPPEGSCKHSCALLLWRARTLSAPRDPTAAAVDGDVDDAPAVDDTTATQPADPAPSAPPPPPPARAGAKRRRLPRSLVQAAAAAGSAATDRATKTARKGAAKGTAGGEGGGGGGAGGPGGAAAQSDASKGTSTAQVKREPGSVAGGGGAATAGAAGESEIGGANGSRQREGSEPASNPRADVVAEAKAITDEQLLAACDRATAAEKAAPDAAPTAPAPTAPAAPADPAAPAAPAAPRPPRRKDLLDDLFDFAPVPSPSSGTTREGSSVEPAPAPDSVPAATISTAAVMNGAVEGANGSRQREGSESVSSGSGGAGGPRKISLAELLGEYGMG